MAHRHLSDRELDALEAMVDATSLGDVLASLSGIADAKSEHVLTNWQDRFLAMAWQKASKRVMAVATSIPVVDVSF
jgi:hypothetical protein